MRAIEPLGRRKLVLGLVHLRPLPGTPYYERDSFERTAELAVQSACALDEGGADGCLVQTVDRLYGTGEDADPARTSALALVVQAAVEAVRPDFEVGVQMMRNALRASLAIAKVAGGSYIRAGALVGTTATAQGLVEPDALGLATYRRAIDAGNVAVVADVASMHYEWLGPPRSAGDVARAARDAGADAVAVSHPDERAALELVESVRNRAPDVPVLLAGGTNHENASRLLRAADGAFVGTCLERGGWGGLVDVERVKAYVDVVRGLER